MVCGPRPPTSTEATLLQSTVVHNPFVWVKTCLLLGQSSSLRSLAAKSSISFLALSSTPHLQPPPPPPPSPHTSTQESWTLFTTLYRSWCHNPVATVALCLLSQNYSHASNLVQKFSNIEITAGLLKEIDELVQLIESPIFSFLRLQLLVPQEQASLVRTLYGLLMLLPQSSAFNCLKQRLSCVSVIIEVEQEGKSRKRKYVRGVLVGPVCMRVLINVFKNKHWQFCTTGNLYNPFQFTRNVSAKE